MVTRKKKQLRYVTQALCPRIAHPIPCPVRVGHFPGTILFAQCPLPRVLIPSAVLHRPFTMMVTLPPLALVDLGGTGNRHTKHTKHQRPQRTRMIRHLASHHDDISSTVRPLISPLRLDTPYVPAREAAKNACRLDIQA